MATDKVIKNRIVFKIVRRTAAAMASVKANANETVPAAEKGNVRANASWTVPVAAQAMALARNKNLTGF